MQNRIPLEDARKIVLENTETMPVEKVPLLDALDRVVAEDLRSDIDVNAFDDAAMDGFAIIAADTADATASNPTRLEIVGVIGAGAIYDGVLQPGEAVRIMTGAAMPKGADTNVMIEKVKTTGDGGIGEKLIIDAPQEAGNNVRKAGEEARAGEVVLAAGSKLTAAGVGLLATTGNFEVPVYKQPIVGIISIGTELVEPQKLPANGMRRDSNRYTIAAMALDAGAEARLYPIIPDEPQTIRDVYERAIDECDYVVSTGGACEGDFDYIGQIASELGDVKFNFVNMRPGKAQTFAVMPNGTLLFGLSGNPAASATGFELLTRPSLRKAQGYRNLGRMYVEAELAGDKACKRKPRRFFMRGTLSKGENGGYIATPMRKQSSQLIGETAKSNCFIDIPEGKGTIELGETVKCMRLDVEEGTAV